jgi:hypothetical protein
VKEGSKILATIYLLKRRVYGTKLKFKKRGPQWDYSPIIQHSNA